MENMTEEQFERKLKDIKESMEANQKKIEANRQFIKELKAKIRENRIKVIKNWINLIWRTILLIFKIPALFISMVLIFIFSLFNLFGVREIMFNLINSGYSTNEIKSIIKHYDNYIIHGSICFYLIIILNHYF